MIADFRERVALHPSTSVPVRLGHGIWRQAALSPLCPDTPRLEGQIALVTGGSRGVGLETSRGLAARGAEVIAASRDASNGEQVAVAIQAAFERPSHFVPLDLGDLAATECSLDQLEASLQGRQLHILVANAGLWPRRHSLSAQGYEIAFATNLLGHHALIRGSLDRRLLADRARVVVVIGDI
ncbi:MAG: SDR family NAD(P)-dependent oxidoreductase, partial [Planctomycetota bacterium]